MTRFAALFLAVSLVPAAPAPAEKDPSAPTVAALRKLGGKVVVDDSRPDRPVIAVDFTWMALTDEQLACVEGLSHLQTLVLDRTKVTNKGLEHVQGLTELRTLSLFNIPIDSRGIVYLKGLTNLENLNLSDTTESSISKACLGHWTSV